MPALEPVIGLTVPPKAGQGNKGGKAMIKGIVKKFDEEKGYGFIARDDGGKDVFFHFSNIETDGFKTLDKEDKVEFEIGEGRDNRKQAVNVRKI